MGALGQLRGTPGESWHKAGSSRARSCCSHCGGGSRAAGDTSRCAGAHGAALCLWQGVQAGLGITVSQGSVCRGCQQRSCIFMQNSSICLAHKVCVTESQRRSGRKRPSKSSAPGTKLTCSHMCASRVHQCAHACAGCAPVCRAHARVGCKHTCACRGRGCVDVLCVYAHVQAALACRGCKVHPGCVHPTTHSGAPT